MTFVIWVLPDIVLEFRMADPEGYLSEGAIAALKKGEEDKGLTRKYEATPDGFCCSDPHCGGSDTRDHSSCEQPEDEEEAQ